MWLAAWKLVSNDAKRTVAPPNAKHSILLQGCFYVFCFRAPSIYPLNRKNGRHFRLGEMPPLFVLNPDFGDCQLVGVLVILPPLLLCR